MKDKIPSVRKQNPAIPQSVENIILKAAAKNPRNRYETAREMHEDLVTCLSEEHANDKKITFEYPENDIDDSTPTPKVTKKVEKPKKENNKTMEDTEDLVKEINTKDMEEEKENDDPVEEYFEEPKRRNTLIIILSIFFLLLLITGGIFWLITTKEVKDVIVPNVVEKTVDEAIEILTKSGFTYTTEQKNSETIESGKVIKTNPKAGSTRKKGDTITIVESIGGNYTYLEKYIGKNYTEVKAKLELLKIHVNIERKDVEDKEKYKEKENIIIEQSPAYDENNPKKVLEPGDTVTLYIPNIVDEYPDMVSEGWNLTNAIAFAKEKKITLTVIDANGKTIPNNEYSKYESGIITKQFRNAGDTIIEGWNLKIQINSTYEEPKQEENEENEENKTQP